MADIAFYNDEFISQHDLKLSGLDLSIHRGYGIFDYFVAEDRKIIWFDDYLDRFYGSADKAKLNIRYERNDLKAIINELVSRNGMNKSGVKLILTGGSSPNGYYPTGRCNLIIFNMEFPESNPVDYEIGTNLIMDEYLRPNPEIKTLNYFNSVLHYDRMKEAGAIDILYHFNDVVYETSRSNVFIVKDGKVITKRDKILQGVTRKNVLRVVEREVQLDLRDFSVSELLDADEVFITSSTKHILPVVKIENTMISDGKVGPVCKHLMKAYTEEVNREMTALAID